MIESLVHVANVGSETLFLRKSAEGQFQWMNQENPVSGEFDSLEKALEYAWRQEGFTPMACGYKFTLPERDEHGTPALFEEMAKSLNSMTGIYFDEREGHNCIVNQIPSNTRRFFEHLKSHQRFPDSKA